MDEMEFEPLIETAKQLGARGAFKRKWLVIANSMSPDGDAQTDPQVTGWR